MDRFLGEPAYRAPYVAGHGTRERFKALINDLDADATRLERSNAVSGRR